MIIDTCKNYKNIDIPIDVSPPLVDLVLENSRNRCEAGTKSILAQTHPKAQIPQIYKDPQLWPTIGVSSQGRGRQRGRCVIRGGQ